MCSSPRLMMMINGVPSACCTHTQNWPYSDKSERAHCNVLFCKQSDLMTHGQKASIHFYSMVCIVIFFVIFQVSMESMPTLSLVVMPLDSLFTSSIFPSSHLSVYSPTSGTPSVSFSIASTADLLLMDKGKLLILSTARCLGLLPMFP